MNLKVLQEEPERKHIYQKLVQIVEYSGTQVPTFRDWDHMQLARFSEYWLVLTSSECNWSEEIAVHEPGEQRFERTTMGGDKIYWKVLGRIYFQLNEKMEVCVGEWYKEGVLKCPLIFLTWLDKTYNQCIHSKIEKLNGEIRTLEREVKQISDSRLSPENYLENVIEE